MGSVFGKETVAEPAFHILLNRTQGVATAYEIRKYGERFAAEYNWDMDPHRDMNKDTGTPFRALARYIGVFGTPENEGSQAIAMTAPVVMEDNSNNKNDNKNQGTKIAMTAPVVMENNNNNHPSKDGTVGKTMKFILPAELDDMSKIPKPTNPNVHIVEIPPQYGAVHRYAGSLSEATNREKAAALAQQLQDDGLAVEKDYVMEHFQFWGYNPPFTLPMFRRNEVWVELTQEQVEQLVQKFNPETSN